ncbi:hypothetical protein [Acinetobacter baumannii]
MDANLGSHTVIDSESNQFIIDLVIPNEKIQAYQSFLKSQKWDDFPFPKTLDIDGIEIRHIDGNLYKDTKGKTYEFVF